MKREIITILLTAVFLTFGFEQVSAQTCIPAPIGLISSYPADGSALDARSRNNGTIQGNVAYAAGQVGQGFQIGGGNGDRVLLGNPRDFQRQDFTIEAWVKRSSSSIVTNSANPGSPAGIFFAYGQGGYAFLIDQNTNKLGLSAVGFSQVLAPTLTITDTNWHHVAVTQSGPAFTAGTVTVFYLDGVADTPVGYAPQFTFATNAAIGSRGDGQTDNVFFGAIDELAIYDRALSASQIQAVFASGTAGKCKPLATNAPDNQVLWLAGDGDPLDSTGNVGSATLQNGAEYQVGKVGQSFKFDGIDDQITVPHNANQNGGTNLTIEAWVNAPGASQGSPILQKRSSANVGGYTLEYFGNQSLQFCVRISGIYQCVAGVNIITNNVWTHVAGTYDGTAVRLIINGGQFNLSQPATGSVDAVSDPIVIGRNVVNNAAFQGSIDEIGVYNRALSISEIQSISNAGLAGKYKVQATVPANIAAWYPADGNTNDLQAANNAALQGGAAYAAGKSGQAFSLNGTNAYVSAPSTAANDPTGASSGASMEAWIYLNQLPSASGRQFYIMSKNGTSGTDGFDIHIDPDNGIKYIWGATNAAFGNPSLQTGQWYHLVLTFNPNTGASNAGTRAYINGVLTSIGNVFNPRTPSNQPLTIGRETPVNVSNTLFNGLIDEPAIYNRALTPDEIRDQYYAGSLGKYKGAGVPTVSNTTKTGDATVTFGGITVAGAVHQTPLDMSLLPPLPLGTNTGLNYGISTSANYTNPTVCFNVPSFTPAQFPNLRIYHLEAGVWQNRTAGSNAYPNLCTMGLTSLSPFVVAIVAPSAANVSISGHVVAGKSGLSNVVVTLSGGSLIQPVSARTNNFGYYKFDNLPVGETYVLMVSSKKYVFTEPTRTVNLLEEITGADFTAETP